MKGRTLATISSALGALLLAPVAAPAQPADAWAHLSALRSSLEAPTPLEARFEQTFVPAGFTDGERERGRVAFSLPECLRWDYDEPFPKSYLLCGHTAWSWNRGEESGRRHILAAEDESGLELLRLEVDRLRTLYTARVEPASEGRWRVRLEPLGAEAPILDAELLIEPADDRLTTLTYHDREGNLTHFSFSDYASMTQRGRFEPPADLVWLTE